MQIVSIDVNFNSDWVLKKSQQDGILPADVLGSEIRNRCEELGHFVLNSSSFIGVSAKVELNEKLGKEEALEKLQSIVKQVIEEVLQCTKETDCLVEVTLGEENEQDKTDKSSKTSEPAKIIEPVKTADQTGTTETVETPEETPAPEKKKLKSFSEENKVETILLGAEPFKKILAELEKIAPRIQTEEETGIISFQNYLFSVGSGFGFSTYLNKLADKLDTLGIFPFDGKDKVKEYELEYPEDERGKAILADQLDTITNVKKFRGIIGLDIKSWLGKENSEAFREALLKLNTVQESVIYAFRVPDIEEFVYQQMLESINDIMYTRAVILGNFSNEDMVGYAKKKLERLHLTVAPETNNYIIKKIVDEKHDGRFYGFHTIEKIVYEMAYHKLLTDTSTSQNILTKEDIIPLLHEENRDLLDSSQMLDNLVGIKEIKGKIEEIVASIELQKKLGEKSGNKNKPCLHMRFVGNPGTGKTTVARIIGKMLKEKGLLRIGGFYEVSKKDLCGRYVGETAPKTAEVCRNAYGSVLFIDEAYSLYRGGGNRTDYGREAIDTLIAEMENHKDDMVVIMAGYPDDIQTLMEANQGMEGRMPYLLEFPSYTREELVEIFMSFVNEEFTYEEDFVTAVKEFINSINEERLQQKDFSNGRFVRNLYDRIWSKAAMRRRLQGEEKLTLTASDVKQAVSDKEFSELVNKKATHNIGFY